MTNSDENLSPSVDDQPEGLEGLFDENGHLRFDLLSSGMFILRFTPGNTALTYAWVPDDPEADIKRIRIPIPQAVGVAAGPDEFFGCLKEELPRISRDEIIEASLASILKCTPKLLE